jgi:dynein heavy chain
MSALERITEGLSAAEAAGLAALKGVPLPVGEDGQPLKPPHPNFRLWLTSYPSSTFPVSVLQNGVKMTNEPPKGLKANLRRSMLSDVVSDPNFYNSVANADLFRRAIVGLCFFHGIIQERRLFGPLGFNIPYEFNESDMRISVMQLAMFLDDPEHGLPAGAKFTREAAIAHVPFKHLRYLTGECNYGGRVTDGNDRGTLMSILNSLYAPSLFELSKSLSPSKEWCMPGPEVKEYKQYMEYIESLPAVASPEVFGLHENAALSRDQMEATKLFDSILLTLTNNTAASKKGGAKVKTKDEVIGELVGDMLGRLRPEFDMEEVGAKYPVNPKESMNTVLIQELARYNRLLNIIKSTLTNVQKAMKGLVVLSQVLESVANDVFIGRVPEVWKSRSFASRKPLAAYFAELVERINMLDTWIEKGPPPFFWIVGFFFPQSFLTGVCQNFARKYVIP